jgi:hypothetical protein
MGRQIAVAATQVDEEMFLSFLRETADVVIFEDFAPTIEQLRVNSFSNELPYHYQRAFGNYCAKQSSLQTGLDRVG